MGSFEGRSVLGEVTGGWGRREKKRGRVNKAMKGRGERAGGEEEISKGSRPLVGADITQGASGGRSATRVAVYHMSSPRYVMCFLTYK